MAEFTVVLLNYSRPTNIQKHILPEILKCKGLKEVIVSHGKDSVVFSYPSPKVRHRYDAALNAKWGVGLRFLAGSEATTACVIFMDDDILVTCEELVRLVDSWAKRPYVMHSFESAARWSVLVPSNGSFEYEYTYKVPKQEQLQTADIVLTRCCAVDAMYVRGLLQWVTQNQGLLDLLESPQTKWNGEDICLSMYVAHKTKSWHSFLPMRFLDLPSPNAISAQGDHKPHRNALVSTLTRLLNRAQKRAILCFGPTKEYSADHQASLRRFADSCGCAILYCRPGDLRAPPLLSKVPKAVFERIEPLLCARDALLKYDRVFLITSYTVLQCQASMVFETVGDVAAWDTYIDHQGVFGDARYDSGLLAQLKYPAMKSYLNTNAILFSQGPAVCGLLSDASILAGLPLFQSLYGMQTYVNGYIAKTASVRVARLPKQFGHMAIQKYEVNPVRTIAAFDRAQLERFVNENHVITITGYFKNRDALMQQLVDFLQPKE